MGFWGTALAAGVGSLIALTVAAIVGRFVANLEVRRSPVGRLILGAVEQMEKAARENERKR